MFTFSTSLIEHQDFKGSLMNPQVGAFVAFEGWVRNHHDEISVLSLEYEVYEKLAVKEGLKIIEEAKKKFDLIDAKAVHRIGKLKIGEVAVWIGVTAAHRKAAFDGCEYIIDEIKTRLPIWKKEFATQGDSGWVNCKG